MIQVSVNPSEVTFDFLAEDLNGSLKTNTVSVTVRVFHHGAGGAEVVDLASTPLVAVAGVHHWKYTWVSPPLPNAGAFIAEYTGTDSDGASSKFREPLIVGGSMKEIEDLHDATFGRGKLDPALDTLTLERKSGVVLKVFDTKNEAGSPDTLDVHERVPRP